MARRRPPAPERDPQVAGTGEPCGLTQFGADGDDDGLPKVLHVEHVADLLHCTPKAVRSRVEHGQFLKPWKDGKRLAWLREDVRLWLAERSRAAPTRPPVHITITSHHYKGKTGLQALWKMQLQGHETKTSALVPESITDRAAAKLWAAEQVEHVLPKLMAKAGLASSSAPVVPTRKAEPQPTITTKPKAGITFREFVQDRFLPEHVAALKESTQGSWHRVLRDHLLPFFGSMPLAAIDEDTLSMFRGRLMRFEPSSRNAFIAKMKKLLRFAEELKKIDRIPLLKRFKQPRIPVETYTPEELELFIEAGARISPTHHLMAQIVADLGLRAGEVCGLRWTDVDLRKGEVLVVHNASPGSGGTPKGTIARLTMSAALRRALVGHKKREPISSLVVMHHGIKGWVPFNQTSLWRELSRISREAGLKKACSARFLRHCMITALGDHGGATTEIQAHARHALISTTEGYLHTRRAPASRSVMARLDLARGEGESLPKTKTRSKMTKNADS